MSTKRQQYYIESDNKALFRERKRDGEREATMLPTKETTIFREREVTIFLKRGNNVSKER